MKGRLLFLIFGSLATFSVLFVNLYHLQIKEGGTYRARAESQTRLSGAFDAQRGTIFLTDKNNTPISAVLNREYSVVFAVPDDIEDVAEASEQLALLLDLDTEEVRKKLSKERDTYELLATKISDEVIELIREASISGVYITKEDFRFYPFGELASHIIGFTAPSSEDTAIRGRYGLEAMYDDFLEGKESTDKDGKVIARDGMDISLTIDRNIQSMAEEVLAGLIKNFDASGGTIIVQEPKTGKILALGNQPTFDPNAYGKASLSDFFNPAVQSIYEPGSIFKVVTMSAGIDSGAITPETTFYDTGSLSLNGYTIRNWDKKAYGTVTMTEVIEHSMNTGAAFAEKKMGHKTFLKYVEKFGFEAMTEIGLPSETVGNLDALRGDYREVNYATAAFGQGVAVTPIGLINAISAIANDGVLMYPYIDATQIGRAHV